MIWDEKRQVRIDKAEEEEYLREIRKAEPEDCVEIPPMYLNFQKMVRAVQMNKEPLWCKQEGKTAYDVVDDMVDWMGSVEHPNFMDMVYAIDQVNEEEWTAESENAYKWLETAMFVWQFKPDADMPSIQIVKNTLDSTMVRNRSWSAPDMRVTTLSPKGESEPTTSGCR
jgi:hypothetical protein